MLAVRNWGKTWKKLTWQFGTWVSFLTDSIMATVLWRRGAENSGDVWGAQQTTTTNIGFPFPWKQKATFFKGLRKSTDAQNLQKMTKYKFTKTFQIGWTWRVTNFLVIDGSIESIIYHMRTMQIHISRLIEILKMVKGYLSSTRTRKSTWKIINIIYIPVQN